MSVQLSPSSRHRIWSLSTRSIRKSYHLAAKANETKFKDASGTIRPGGRSAFRIFRRRNRKNPPGCRRYPRRAWSRVTDSPGRNGRGNIGWVGFTDFDSV